MQTRCPSRNSRCPLLSRAGWLAGLAGVTLLGGCVVAERPARRAYRGPPPPPPVAVVAPDPGTAPAEVIVEAPPPPRREIVVETARPSPRHVWVRGYWVYRNHRHVWVEGHWDVPPRAGAVWVEPRWEARPGGSVFISGYWR